MNDATGIAEERGDYARLLARAEALVPALAAASAETEALRRVPPATVALFRESGLVRILQPARAGGAELPYRAIVEFPAMLARGCGSASWVYANLAAHSWMLGMWPQAAQDEVWDADRDALIASALIYRNGRASRVAGGYRVSGGWPFSSGVDVASWNMLGAVCAEAEGEEPQPRMFLVPAAQCTIVDTWHVTGLAGTGSKDVRVGDVFVPEHRTLASSDTAGGGTPGSLVNTGPLYRLPMRALVSYCLAGTALGIAEGAVAGFSAAMRTRLGAYTGRNLADFALVQLRLAEAAATCEAARAVLLRNCDAAMAWAARDEVPPLEERARYRRDGAFATRLSTRAVDLLFTASGGSAVYTRAPLQRAFRDVHAANAHFGLSWDVNGAIFGRVALGLPPDAAL